MIPNYSAIPSGQDQPADFSGLNSVSKPNFPHPATPPANISHDDLLNLYLESIEEISRLKEESIERETHITWLAREVNGQGQIIKKLMEKVTSSAEDHVQYQNILASFQDEIH
jgi:hypothetical protein